MPHAYHGRSHRLLLTGSRGVITQDAIVQVDAIELSEHILGDIGQFAVVIGRGQYGFFVGKVLEGKACRGNRSKRLAPQLDILIVCGSSPVRE